MTSATRIIKEQDKHIDGLLKLIDEYQLIVKKYHLMVQVYQSEIRHLRKRTKQ